MENDKHEIEQDILDILDRIESKKDPKIAVTYSILMHNLLEKIKDPFIAIDVRETISQWSEYYSSPLNVENVLRFFENSERVVGNKIKLECGLKVRILGAGDVMISDKVYAALDIDGFIKAVNRHDGWLKWKHLDVVDSFPSEGLDTVTITIENTSDEPVTASLLGTFEEDQNTSIKREYSVGTNDGGWSRNITKKDLKNHVFLKPLAIKEMEYNCLNPEQMNHDIFKKRYNIDGSNTFTSMNIGNYIHPSQMTVNHIKAENLDMLWNHQFDMEMNILGDTKIFLVLHIEAAQSINNNPPF